MGPYQMADLAGGDIGWATRKRRAATRDPALRYVRIPDLLCERDWFGQKTGRGFYLYPDGARQGEPDPEVLALIDENAAAPVDRPGILPGRDPASLPGRHDQQGRQRAARGHRAAPLGYRRGVPVRLRLSPAARRPMHYADSVGLERVLADVRAYAAEDPAFWKPSPLLAELAASGRGFASLNR